MNKLRFGLIALIKLSNLIYISLLIYFETINLNLILFSNDEIFI